VSVRNRYQSAEEVLRALEIEPYLESLAQGLLVKSDPNQKDAINPRPENSGILAHNPPGVGNSGGGAAQVAAAIRARRAKNAESDGIRQGSSAGKPKTLGNYSRITSQHQNNQKRKLNAEGLLTAYFKGRRDFALHNLSFLKLPGADLSETNFHSAQFQSTNFQGANLQKSDFGRANLTRANLRDANLSNSYFHHADLEGADLRGADLTEAYFTNANLRGANLCGANLTGAKVSDEQLALAKTNWMTIRPNGKRGLF
jgi:serine/threonine protein kinase, bacterial